MNSASKQKERRDRGQEFQDEIRRSWRLVPNVWRMRISDGRGSTRPADEIVTTANGNFLIEAKRTQGDKFELSFIRPNQFRGLLNFEVIPRNFGLVFVSFLSKDIDEAYAFRLSTVIKYMQERRFRYIARNILKNFVTMPAIQLPRTYYHDPKDKRLSGPAYDLTEVINNCQLL
ncbi:hypothetical protein HSX37_16345|uniref:Uncharacterized protein n=1 Tax=Dendrosporobacter quercicolus TaxID=146817 RepID=A0A1G9ZUA3_9FIRM|nr:hypothetical protein [Dendrosporobacter quercicolus]NSL49607.1 hypothetical protein [Dendrosporobacter quercicolus DSM 1736]SDN24707.1 hypothetical protein SAMN04488502_11563 [Dendrosporobacter quercicolus]